MGKKRKVCVVTGSRAEYGLLYWVMRNIQESLVLDLHIIVTGMHLSPEFGITYLQIEEDGFVDNLVKWADVIRQSFKQGAVDDIITTRRLIDITKTFSIFRDKMKSIVLCLERFDDETRESFVDFYSKVDAGVSMDDLLNAESEIIEEDKDEEDSVPF